MDIKHLDKNKKFYKKEKSKYYMGSSKIFLIFLTILFLIGSISAEMLVSDSGVGYDSEISSKFLFSKWVNIMIKVNDFSNVTIDYGEDSIETQEMKDNQMWEIYRQTSDNILSNLSEEEFILEERSEFGIFIVGEITQEGFNKLLNDTRVKHIYAEKEGWQSSISNHTSIIFVFFVLIFIFLIILILKLRKNGYKK
jgi:hypothetical protein